MTPRQLRRIRRRLGLTQAGLAARLGVRTNTIWRWEAGQRAISKPVAQLVETFRSGPHRLGDLCPTCEREC